MPPQRYFPTLAFKIAFLSLPLKSFLLLPLPQEKEMPRLLNSPHLVFFILKILLFLHKFSCPAVPQRKRFLPPPEIKPSRLCSRQLLLHLCDPILQLFSLFSRLFFFSLQVILVQQIFMEALFCVRHHPGHHNTKKSKKSEMCHPCPCEQVSSEELRKAPH